MRSCSTLMVVDKWAVIDGRDVHVRYVQHENGEQTVLQIDEVPRPFVLTELKRVIIAGNVVDWPR